MRTHDLEGYLVDNHSTPTLTLIFTTLATFVGGDTSIGLMAMGYESGFARAAIGKTSSGINGLPFTPYCPDSF